MSLSDNTDVGFKEKTLTVRDHSDPDKHWIGESLAPPSQTEIAATVGLTAGPGDSPFVARADHTHKIDSKLSPISDGVSGPDDIGPTSGTTPLNIKSITVPTTNKAGCIHIWGQAYFSKTVGSDSFSLTLTSGASTMGATRENTGASGSLVVTGSMAVTGSAPIILNLNLTRTVGTGTATLAAGVFCVLHYIFIPSIS